MSKTIRKRVRKAKEALEASRFEDGTRDPSFGKRGGRATVAFKNRKAYTRKRKHRGGGE